MREKPTIDTLYADIVALRADLDDFAARSTRDGYSRTMRFNDDGRLEAVTRRAKQLHADAYALSPLGQKAATILGG